jgi:hypothetical protein
MTFPKISNISLQLSVCLSSAFQDKYLSIIMLYFRLNHYNIMTQFSVLYSCSVKDSFPRQIYRPTIQCTQEYFAFLFTVCFCSMINHYTETNLDIVYFAFSYNSYKIGFKF